MDINVLLKENGMTRYRLSKLSGVPHATLSDLCSGKSRIKKVLCGDLIQNCRCIAGFR